MKLFNLTFDAKKCFVVVLLIFIASANTQFEDIYRGERLFFGVQDELILVMILLFSVGIYVWSYFLFPIQFPIIISLIPTINHSFKIFVFSASIVEIFIFFDFLKYVLKNKKININLLNLSLLFLIVIAVLSQILGDSNHFFWGATLRYSVVLVYCMYILSEEKKSLTFSHIEYGLKLLPICAIATAIGQKIFLDVITFGQIFELYPTPGIYAYPLWLGFFILYLSANKISKYIWFLYMSLQYYFCFSRSLILSIIINLFIASRVKKLIIILLFIMTIIYSFGALKAFDADYKKESNNIRITKIIVGLSSSMENILIGSGFNVQNIDNNQLSEKKLLSTENGIIQILVEMGVFGLLPFLFILGHGYKSTHKIAIGKGFGINEKYSVFFCSLIVTTYLIGSNVTSLPIFYLLIIIPIIIKKTK